MLKLADGRKKLYQWDTDVKVNVEIDAEFVDFRLISSYKLLRVEVKDKIAMIPNILLQDGGAILAYANCVCDGQQTKCEAMFDVTKRPKPIDYVYTETELKNWDNLEKRIDELEKRGVDVDITVDSELNIESENPIQNKAVAKAVDDLKSETSSLRKERVIHPLPCVLAAILPRLFGQPMPSIVLLFDSIFQEGRADQGQRRWTLSRVSLPVVSLVEPYPHLRVDYTMK